MKHVLQGVLTVLLAASPAVADRTISKTLPLAADGKVTLETYKGTAALVGLSGTLDLKTYKGEVKAGFTHGSDPLVPPLGA